MIINAQEEEFNFSDFEEATDAKIFVNNKVIGLSPTKLLNLSFDYAGANTWTTSAGEAFTGNYAQNESRFNRNSGLRLESNYPVVSNNRLIVNAYLNYWESRYSADASAPPVAQVMNNNPLRTSALGALIFKPLNDKQFLIFQVEAALNGNYNFGSINPAFDKTKFSASALYGWKKDDYTNMAVGLTRTYRGGRLLHIPVFMWNKTFNKTWGVEMLLPARAAVRRNLSPKSFMMLGYELEGQSYHIQGENETSISPQFNSNSTLNDWELRKSEIRARISWDKSITDFIWFNVQAGAVFTYRMDIDQAAMVSNAWLTNSARIPLYFRFGIQLVSP
jgi:hypothetical protein